MRSDVRFVDRGLDFEIEIEGESLGFEAADPARFRAYLTGGLRALFERARVETPAASTSVLAFPKPRRARGGGFGIAHPGVGGLLRGPIGGYFVWEPPRGGPLQLVAGGRGLVPLMAMARSLQAGDGAIAARMLVSARTQEDLIYREELGRLPKEFPNLRIDYTLTRSQPSGWKGYARRVDQAMLVEATFGPDQKPAMYVCGPTGFVETVATTMRELGHEPARIRTERFGPTGG